MTDAGAELDVVLACRAPLLIGVRHHSVACALALPALLEAAAPTRIYVELPSVFQPWVPWITHPGTRPPLALAHAGPDGVAFFPLAAFSPERVALQWGADHGVDVVLFDTLVDTPSPGATTGGAWLSRWDEWVESRAGGDPEDLRRAALRVGHAARATHPPDPATLEREAHMRALLAGTRERSVAVVGAYHAAALVDDTPGSEAHAVPDDLDPATSLVPYTHRLLDERSGYPAGIADPGWHEALYEAHLRGDEGPVLEDLVVRTLRALRSRGHAGPADAAVEVVRLARGLAALRGLPTPTRLVLREALRTVLGGGEGGFDHAVDTVLIGRSRGLLPADAPRSGLAVHLERECRRLKLPAPGDEASLRLDVLRSPLHRERHLLLVRARLAGIRYGTPEARVAQAGLETLTRSWDVRWDHHTDATLPLAAMAGVTLRQAAEGTLRTRRAQAEAEDDLRPAVRRALLTDAFEAGLVELGAEWLAAQAGRAAVDASLEEIFASLELFGRLAAGSVPGFDPSAHAALTATLAQERASLLATAEGRLMGLLGSEDPADARALVALVRACPATDRLHLVLRRFLRDAGPLMRGAAFGAWILDGLGDVDAGATWIASHIDGATDAAGRRALALALTGLFSGTAGLLGMAGPLVDALVDRVDALHDDAFLRRLPALRVGFGALVPSERADLLRLLQVEGIVSGHAVATVPSADALVHHATLDHAAMAAVQARWHLDLAPPPKDTAPPDLRTPVDHPDRRLSTGDRFRLVLAREQDRLTGLAAQVAASLEAPPLSAGHGGVVPRVRAWVDELTALVGADVCQEVVESELGRHPLLLDHLDPDAARPSAELLTRILELAGGLGEGAVARVRPLIRRIVQALTEQLATQVLPALRGVRCARPTRRRGPHVDLRRTIARNLHTAHRDEDGALRLAPEHVVFRTASGRQVPWEVVVLLDVSGSMEPSVVHTAVLASILCGVPWVELRLLAFSTDVVDLTEHAPDPLRLLLEVQVGGGTHIGQALQVAQAGLRRPARSLVLTVSDFCDGGPPGQLFGTVRSLRESGVRLLGLASLDGEGHARFDAACASQLQQVGMPVAALGPARVAGWIREQVLA